MMFYMFRFLRLIAGAGMVFYSGGLAAYGYEIINLAYIIAAALLAGFGVWMMRRAVRGIRIRNVR